MKTLLHTIIVVVLCCSHIKALDISTLNSTLEEDSTQKSASTSVEINHDYSRDDIHCSRRESRMVRLFLEKNVYSQLNDPLESMLSQCPLHPSVDRFIEQERNKNKIERKTWQCSYCNKKFVSEYYIDRHMDRKHSDKLKQNSTNCFADYCNIFGCPQQNVELEGGTKRDDLNEDSERKLFSRRSSPKKFETASRCTDKLVEKYKYKCRLIAKKCFTSAPGEYNAVSRSRLCPLIIFSHSIFQNQDSFTTQVCDALYCSKGKMIGAMEDTVLLDEDEKTGVLFLVLQLMLCVVILIVVFLNC